MFHLQLTVEISITTGLHYKLFSHKIHYRNSISDASKNKIKCADSLQVSGMSAMNYINGVQRFQQLACNLKKKQ